MRKIYLLIFLALPVFGFSQIENKANGGLYKFNPNNIVCLTEEARAQIKIELNNNVNALIKQGKLSQKKSIQETKFSWPIRAKENSGFTNVWAISAFVDHNKNFPDKVEDYNCGTRTYDTQAGYNHQGTDMFTWPFTWYQFENNIGEVIAAAAGTITLKQDGEFDMSCGGNTADWNAIYIEHSDGSVAWYGHLKKGSLTSKNVGDTVIEGEFLANIGSSGNSGGPHLHFEVYDSNGELVDPYQGNCSGGTSWWKNQPDYYEPNINALFTHNLPPEVSNTCPQIEATNIADTFLPNTTIYTAAYYRDQLNGTTASYKLYRPNGAVYSLWTFDFSSTASTSHWYWTWNNLSDIGVWTFECSYQGQTVTKTFEIANALGVENLEINKITFAPNPFESILRLIGSDFKKEKYKISIFNNLGQKVFSKNTFSGELDLQFLPQGMYFLKLTDKADNNYKTFTLSKK